MRLFIICIGVICMFGCATTGDEGLTRGSSVYGGSVHWYSLQEGMEKAFREKKPSVVDFFISEGCPRCENMKKFVYSNSQITAKLNAEFIPVKIDLGKPLTDREKALGEKWKFNNDCLLLFMDYEGNVLEDNAGKKLCIVEYVDPEWFMKYLDMAKEKMKKP